jgi:hypothetical protein
VSYEPIPDEAIEAAVTWVLGRFRAAGWPPSDTIAAMVRDRIERYLADGLWAVTWGPDLLVQFRADMVEGRNLGGPWHQIWPDQSLI